MVLSDGSQCPLHALSAQRAGAMERVSHTLRVHRYGLRSVVVSLPSRRVSCWECFVHQLSQGLWESVVRVEPVRKWCSCVVIFHDLSSWCRSRTALNNMISTCSGVRSTNNLSVLLRALFLWFIDATLVFAPHISVLRRKPQPFSATI